MNWTWSIPTICGHAAQSNSRFNLAFEGYEPLRILDKTARLARAGTLRVRAELPSRTFLAAASALFGFENRDAACAIVIL
jgi:hypothetical protein